MQQTTQYRIHPALELFPSLDGDAFDQLLEDIRRNGQRDAIVLDEYDVLLDGRARLRACQELGLQLKTMRRVDDDEAECAAYVISRNLHRRHLSESQRAMVAAKWVALQRGDLSRAPIGALRQAMMGLNVSERGIDRAAAVLRDGVPDLARAVDSGELSVSAAEQIARQPAVAQRAIVRSGKHRLTQVIVRRPARGTVIVISKHPDVESLADQVEKANLDADVMEAWGRELIARAKRIRAEAKAARAGLHSRRR